MKAVIFAGGVGTRLWPLSRKKSPKQFEKVIGDKSTLQLAVERLYPLFKPEDIYISTGAQYAEIVAQQIPKAHVISEPAMRDVGPAVGLVTALLMREHPHTPFTILWSDHLVKKEELFRKIIQAASTVIHKEHNKIVFISQRPRFASQNLGWIEYGDAIEKVDNIALYAFQSFKYRPTADVAEKFFTSHNHAWNLGYFVTTPIFLWKQFEQFAPELFEKLVEIQKTVGTKKFEKTLADIYPTVEKIHFDNVILEKLRPEQAYVMSEDIGWSDVGAWEALKEALQEDSEENVTKGKVFVTDSRDSLIYNYTNQAVFAIDLDGHVVINTGDVVLVCHKKSVPKIKKLVESLSGGENDHLV